MSDVSVVGLGNMGAALVRALLTAGTSVTVWNRTPEKANPLVQAGAKLAGSLAEAIAASDALLVCVKNHDATREILADSAGDLRGKVVIDLSTGGAAEAEALVSMLTGAGAGWMIGMINAYPSGIGKPETAILCAGPDEIWRDWKGILQILGGASNHVGTTAAAVPGLFAAMFTARQGFMFGLIFGGAVCRRAGVPMDVFAAQMPVTLGMAGSYGELFARTVPAKAYDDPGATMAVYLDALNDVMATFEATGTQADFPALMRDTTLDGVSAGLQDKQLTALVEHLAGNR